MRHGQQLQVEVGVDEPPRLVDGHIDAGGFEQAEDGPGLGGPRRVVVSRQQEDRRLGKRLPEPLHLLKGEDDRRIRGPHGVKEIPRHHDHLRPHLEQGVHDLPEGHGDIGLALVQTRRGLPVVLPVAEVRVSEMRETHATPSRRGLDQEA
jgi:hypothetical protein